MAAILDVHLYMWCCSLTSNMFQILYVYILH